jgi:hypothetical protein
MTTLTGIFALVIVMFNELDYCWIEALEQAIQSERVM